MDGEEEGIYDDVQQAVLSPNGSRYAYVAYSGERGATVVDGERGKYDRYVHEPTFSPDSRRIARIAVVEGWDHVVVLDGRETERHDGDISGLTFSPDSRRLAYKVRDKAGKKFLVTDGPWVGKPYDKIRHLGFSPDSKHLIYVAV